MNSKTNMALELARSCFRVLEEKKAADLVVLDVSRLSSVTDYLVIATATSGPHLRALRVALENALDAGGVHMVGVDATQDSGWMVMDAFDVMIHLFLAETRERFGLERLWRDADGTTIARSSAKTRNRRPAKRRANEKRIGPPRSVAKATK